MNLSVIMPRRSHLHRSRARLVGMALLALAGGSLAAAPAVRVLVHADFEDVTAPLAYRAAAAVSARATLGAPQVVPGLVGNGIGLNDGELVIDLAALTTLAEEGTISFAYRVVQMPAFGTPPPFLTVRDTAGATLFEINVSGQVTTPDLLPDGNAWGGVFPRLIPDNMLSLEWKHAALTWRRAGAGFAAAPDLVRFWTDHGVASWRELELGARQPAEMRLHGGAARFIEIDQLYVLDTAVHGRTLFELDRNRRRDIAELEHVLGATEAWGRRSETWQRDDAIRQALAGGIIVPATPGPIRPFGGYDGLNLLRVVDGSVLEFDVPEDGAYTVLLRYQRERVLDFERESNAQGLFWRENGAALEVTLAGQRLSERFYPTGRYWLWSCDTEVFKFHALNGGKALALKAGRQRLEFHGGGIALHLVALTRVPIPELSQPRWIDNYQMPPQMLVADMQETVQAGDVRRVYTITFRARLEEPMTYDVVLDDRQLRTHRAELLDARLVLDGRRAERSVRVAVTHPAGAPPSSEKIVLHLWHDQTPSWMSYWLYDVVKTAIPGPPVEPPATADVRTWVRTWAATADPAERQRLVREQQALQRQGTGESVIEQCATVGQVLAHWDAMQWFMALSPTELDAWIPDGPAVSNNPPTELAAVLGRNHGDVWHGLTWRAGREQTRSPVGWGMWHHPAGDSDLAQRIDAENWLDRGDRKNRIVDQRYVAKQWQQADADWIRAIQNYRNQLWVRFIGGERYSSIPQGALPLLSRMYHLTGDEAYAQQCWRIVEHLSRKCWYHPKKFFTLHRDDRDNWGSTAGHKWPGWNNLGFVVEAIRAFGRVQPALDAGQRLFWEHNGIRAIFRDIASSGRHEDVSWSRTINMERPFPSRLTAQILGDVDFLRQDRESVAFWLGQILPDGMHICGLSTYGAPGTYGRHLQDFLSDQIAAEFAFATIPDTYVALLCGVEVACQFMFANSMVPNMGHGAGNPWADCNTMQPEGAANLLALLRRMHERERAAFDQALAGRIVECADGRGRTVPEMLDYLETLVPIPRRLLGARLGGDEGMAARLDALYADFPEASRPHQPSRLAAARGIGILRNREPASWRDWVEVLVDYGTPNQRAHDDAAKLHLVLFGNGQIQNVDYGYHGSFHNDGRWRGWTARTIAHSTVMVDESDQAVAPGWLHAFQGNGAFHVLDAGSTALYPGVDLRRTVVLADGYVLDLFRCAAAQERQFDWMWHNYGRLATDHLPFADTTIGDPAQAPWMYIAKAQTVPAPEQFTVEWKNGGAVGRAESAEWYNHSVIPEPHTLRLHGLTDGASTLVRFAGPENWSKEKALDYVWTRRRAERTVFVHVLEPYRDANGPRIQGIESVPVVDRTGTALPRHVAAAVRLTLDDGRRQDLIVRNYSGAPVQVGGQTFSAPLTAIRHVAGQETARVVVNDLDP